MPPNRRASRTIGVAPTSTRPSGEVRIIGGSLKRSKIGVIDRPGLRPTPDRVRETVFNWLAPRLPGARVLDLCAGTGVLGLEAISRGAAYAHLNEPDRDLANRIRADADRLKVGHCVHVSQQQAQTLLRLPATERFDGVFVDPPYGSQLWPALLSALPAWLAAGAWVYIEHPRELPPPFGPNWRVLREGQAGQIAYYLLESAEASASVVT